MAIDFDLRANRTRERQQSDLKGILNEWKSSAENDLPQHRSQILSAHRTLDAILTRLADQADPLPSGKYTQLVLSAHRIWDYYQSKFAQRRLKHTTDFLEVADQFACDCYQPAAGIVKKAPPLIVFSGASSPYIQRRDSPFSVEAAGKQQGLSSGEAVSAAIKHLPFAVIGIPWYQRAQLEGLVAIGHEVGHAVEDDLALTPALRTLCENNVPPERAGVWKGWQRELFADAWGCVSVGPAFAYGLADFLAPDNRWKEPVTPGTLYPPAWLRIRCMAGLLEALKLNAPAMDEWVAAYPADEDGKAYIEDAVPLMKALVETDLPPLGKLSKWAFSAKDAGRAVTLANGWAPPAAGVPPPAPVVKPGMRVTVAAVRLAYETRPDLDFQTSAMAALKGAIVRGFRDASPPSEQVDKARAAQLVALLTF